MGTFFLQALNFGVWLPRIPEVQARLGLGPSDLAFALLGMPIGLLLALPFAGHIVAKVGGRNTIRWAFPVFLVLICLPPAATDFAMLFLGLVGSGISMAMIELGMNVVADEIEKRDNVAIMSRCHGFWSLGMMAGSLVGSGFAAIGLAPHWSLLLASVLAAPLAILVPRAPPTPARRRRRRLTPAPRDCSSPGCCCFRSASWGWPATWPKGPRPTGRRCT